MSEVSTTSSSFSGAAEAYEDIMGRWSRRLAGPFIDFVGLAEGETVLDVGCGTGSLTLAVAERVKGTRVTGVDLSEAYIAFARAHSEDQRITFETADACALPYADGAFDRVMSMLVLNFVPDAPAAAAEMVRVTRPGGIVAAAVWDLRGGFTTSQMFWNTAAAMDAEAAEIRARYFSGPYTRPGELAAAWTAFGLRDVVQDYATIRMDFDSFEDFWRPFLGKTGPVGGYIAGLSEGRRATLQSHLRAAYEAGDPDGPRSFAATAWVCRGRMPN
jgi:ubiquinone/menaquinone biosynthesis C-methylase UbiE